MRILLLCIILVITATTKLESIKENIDEQEEEMRRSYLLKEKKDGS